MNIYNYLITVPLFALLSFAAGAHEARETLIPVEGLSVGTSVGATIRSKEAVSPQERWIVPGFLMGGEALPYEKGLSLDTAYFNGAYRVDRSYIVAKLASHGMEHGLELEHTYIGYGIAKNLSFEAGIMTGLFSPYQALHAIDTRFANPLLINDVLWGRHYTDKGLRLIGNSSFGLKWGLEAWNGDRFPAAANDKDSQGAYDGFLSYQWRHNITNFQIGLFHYEADAKQRSDSRYSSSHTHQVNNSSSPSYYFDGHTIVQGYFASLNLNVSTVIFGVQGEWQKSQSEGDLKDSTRMSPFKTKYQAAWLEVYTQWQSHSFAIRHEHLRFKNTIDGAAANILAEAAGLIADKDPFRTTASYNYQCSPELRLKLEWSHDFTQGEKKDIGLLSAVWKTNHLLSQGE